MTISEKAWREYIEKLSQINEKASELMRDYIIKHGLEDRDALIRYANSLTSYYGSGAGSLACLMYDKIAFESGVNVSSAEIAELPSYKEVAIAVNGTLKQSPTGNLTPDAIGRLVKRTGADTILKNAKRDRAQFAWIPSGDTCAFCLALASRGWQYVSRNTLKNGHAEHIHAHCDCTYAIRFNSYDNVQGYDPDAYLKMYENVKGDTPEEKIKNLRNTISVSPKNPNNTEHIEKRKKERGATDKEIESIIKNPLHKSGVYIDEYGRPFVEYIGNKHTVIINPATNSRITVKRTPKKERDKWKKK